MASIQGAMNQLLGAVAGTATIGSYMYKQSNTYQAKQAEKQVEDINKTFDVPGGRPGTYEGIEEVGQKAVALREKALELKPTKQRAEALRKAYKTQQELLNYIAESKAHDILMQQEALKASTEQTLKYQEALKRGKADGTGE